MKLFTKKENTKRSTNVYHSDIPKIADDMEHSLTDSSNKICTITHVCASPLWYNLKHSNGSL
jgi:hypothetical protein